MRNNLVSNVAGAGNGTKRGIYTGDGIFVVGNTIYNAQVGVALGKYKDNLTFDCATPYSGGVDAGGNN